MSAAAAAALPTFSAAGKAAAAAGVGAGVWGKFAWGYSRSLYLFDAGFRFERMCSGYDFANAQQEMFRNDLIMLTELTFRKMGVYTVIGTMGMAIFIAIFCAGRLGLHGPSPPIWIMGLFLTNIAMAFAMAGMGIWMAFHAMWRAKAACLHLNTRKVRLMIPTRKKLDDARKYGNQWEHQKIRDLLRVPYVSAAVGHKWSGEVPDCSDDEEDYSDYSTTGSGSGGRAHSAPPTNGRRKGQGKKRAPCWYTEEFEQERVGVTGGSGNAGQRSDAPPEHFQLYAKAQKEWFTFDCYSRVCMFVSFLSFFQGASFYGLGQINIELRAWWPAFANNFIFMVLHFLMLKFDIVKNPANNTSQTGQEKLPYCQYFGTACIPLAAIGMALDFRVEYDPVFVHLTWVFIFLCYICQIIYSARLVELIQPTEVKREERVGANWWPVGWKVPASFQHVFYFVAPPPRLAVEQGQVDVVREMKEGYYSKKPSDAKEDLGSPRGADHHVMGLEDHFQWLMHSAWPSLSQPSKDKVRALKHRFAQETSRLRGTELANSLGHIEAELRGIEKEELQGDASKSEGYDSGSGSSGSGSDYSSGYSSAGSGRSDYSKEYTKDTARYHPDGPAFTRVTYVEPAVLVTIVTSTFFATWIFLTLGMVIDRITGVQGLVTAPHWAKPPMTRSSKFPWERGSPLGLQRYSGETPWIPEELFWHENAKKRPGGWNPHWMSFGHEGRRLSATSSPSMVAGMSKEGMKQAFTNLMSSLPNHEVAKELLKRVPTQEEATALSNLENRFRHNQMSWHPQAFTWPGFFEPKLLACAPSKDGVRQALAITPRGVVAAAHLGGDGGAAERFVLTGLSNYPPLLAASWSPGPKEGLMLVSKEGDLLHCPGARQGNKWACGPLANAPPRVPLAEGSRIHAAASMWLGSGSEPRLHTAVILESSPDVIALWVLEGNTEAASWLPLGELPVPHKMARGASLVFVNDGELLLATADGATVQRRITDGTVVTSTPALNFGEDKQHAVQWQAACGLHGPSGGIVHLSMRQQATTRHPEVMELAYRGA